MKHSRAIASFMLLTALTAGAWFVFSGTADAQDWKADYERLCGTQVEDPDAPLAELEGVLKEVEALGKTVEGMDFPQKKNYVFRIGKCRDLIKYYIESKKSN